MPTHTCRILQLISLIRVDFSVSQLRRVYRAILAALGCVCLLPVPESAEGEVAGLRAHLVGDLRGR